MKTQYPEELTQEQRDKLGMVFTSQELADFIVDRAFYYLDQSRSQKESCSGEPLTILEPSIGGGSFYNALADKILLREGSPREIEKQLHHIYGLDIQQSAVDLALENISAHLHQKGIKNKDFLRERILQGDFLSEETLGKFSEKKVDLIIGNPPYIGEKGNKDLFRKMKTTDFGRRYYEKGMDYFYYFIQRSLEILSDQGILAFITTSYWTRADSASKLRQSIRQQAGFLEVIDSQNLKFFPDAWGQNNMILLLQKGYRGDFSRFEISCRKKEVKEALKQIHSPVAPKKNEGESLFQVHRCENDFTQNFSPYFVFVPKKEAKIIQNIHRQSSLSLSQIADINQGIVSGADKVTPGNIEYLSPKTLEQWKITPGDGIFVLSEKEKEHLSQEVPDWERWIHPFYKNSAIGAYCLGSPQGYLIYISPKSQDIPQGILYHLKKYEEILQRRREVINRRQPYYALNWGRNQKIFQGEKIVVPQRAYPPKFALSKEDFYASADVYFINNIRIDSNFLLAYLNSSLVEYYLRYMGKRKGQYYELYTKPLSEIPILSLPTEVVEEIGGLAKKIQKSLIITERENFRKWIDEILWEKISLDS